MGHRIEVIVGVRGSLASLADRGTLVVLPQGYELLALPSESLPPGTLAMAGSFRALTGEWVRRIEVASRGRSVAYLETDYFAGLGRQSAAVWQDGELVLGPLLDDELAAVRTPLAQKPINTALRALGVTTRGEMDEFDCLQLGAARWNREWAELAATTALSR